MNAHPIEQLSEYVDDELSPRERARIEAHLSECPKCARLVGDLEAVVAAAAGIVVPATHGTRTTADEPQYLLTAISLAEDGDLDIADELADGRWRPFHALPLPEQTEPLADGRRLSPHDPLLPLLLAGPVAAAGWVGAKLAMAAMAGLLAALALWTAVRRLDVPVATAASIDRVLPAPGENEWLEACVRNTSGSTASVSFDLSPA